MRKHQTARFHNLLETAEAQQGVVGDRFDLVRLQIDVSQVLHPSDGSGNSPEVVLKTQQLLQRRLLDEDAVRDAEEVAVGQVEAHQLLQACKGPCVKVADVLVVCHAEVHQVGEALQESKKVCFKWYSAALYKTMYNIFIYSKHVI